MTYVFMSVLARYDTPSGSSEKTPATVRIPHNIHPINMEIKSWNWKINKAYVLKQNIDQMPLKKLAITPNQELSNPNPFYD